MVDDGDRTSYIRRLEDWHEARTEEDIRLDSKYEALEGGLRVPERIWSRLYQYQKVRLLFIRGSNNRVLSGVFFNPKFNMIHDHLFFS